MVSIPYLSPSEFVSRISSKANLSEKTMRDARKILEFGHEAGITSGKHPMSMAAAAAYLALQANHEHVSQATIAHVSGISAVTIRSREKRWRWPKENNIGTRKFQLQIIYSYVEYFI